jgi:hypothetical protein
LPCWGVGVTAMASTFGMGASKTAESRVNSTEI